MGRFIVFPPLIFHVIYDPPARRNAIKKQATFIVKKAARFVNDDFHYKGVILR